MKIYLKNDFHNTEVCLTISKTRSIFNSVMIGDLSRDQVRRSKKILCGHADCQCSGVAGLRGEQSILAYESYQDGSVRIAVKKIDDTLG